jgi:hypothetical protein
MRISRPAKFRGLPAEIAIGVQAFYESYDAEVSKGTLWQWAKLPLFKLTEEVWSDPVLNEGHESFEAYHRWYKQPPWPPKWTRRNPDSIYPIIMTGPPGGPYDPEKGIIEDGWHRFHWYVDHWGPNKLIPVVWSVG